MVGTKYGSCAAKQLTPRSTPAMSGSGSGLRFVDLLLDCVRIATSVSVVFWGLLVCGSEAVSLHSDQWAGMLAMERSCVGR